MIDDNKITGVRPDHSDIRLTSRPRPAHPRRSVVISITHRGLIIICPYDGSTGRRDHIRIRTEPVITMSCVIPIITGRDIDPHMTTGRIIAIPKPTSVCEMMRAVINISYSVFPVAGSHRPFTAPKNHGPNQ